jgi:hypothetical protein
MIVSIQQYNKAKLNGKHIADNTYLFNGVLYVKRDDFTAVATKVNTVDLDKVKNV